MGDDELRRPRKTWQKVAFWVLIGIIAFGLVGSGLVGLIGLAGLDEQNDRPQPASIQDFAARLQELERRVQADPEDIAGRIELAVYYKEMMDFERATELFEEVLALDANNQRVRVDLAEMCFVLQDYDQAVAHLEALLRINPNHRMGLFLYGVTLGDGLEDYPRAVQALERYLDVAGTDAPEAEYVQDLLAEWRAK